MIKFISSIIFLTPLAFSQNLIQQWAYDDINLSSALEFVSKYGENKEIIVAIIDPSGVDYTHPYLQEFMWRNQSEIPDNGIDDDNNGYIDDYYGVDIANKSGIQIPTDSHATHIAGIYITSQPEVRIMSIGINLPQWWTGDSFITLAYILGTAVEAIKYGVDNGADVINLSWGALEDIVEKMAPSYEEFFQKEGIGYAMEKGAMVVIASGNSNTNSFFPANIDEPNVLTVSALENNGKKASYSNWAEWVDISAPGEVISSVIGGKFEKKMGTSMATPVAGKVITLIKQITPDLNQEEIREIIIQSTRPIDPDYKGYLGTGEVDAELAVKSAYVYSHLYSLAKDRDVTFEKLVERLNNLAPELLDEGAKERVILVAEELFKTGLPPKISLANFFFYLSRFGDWFESANKIFFRSIPSNEILSILKGSSNSEEFLAILNALQKKKIKDILNGLPLEQKMFYISQMDLDIVMEIFAGLEEKEQIISLLSEAFPQKSEILKVFSDLESGNEINFDQLKDLETSALAKICEHLPVNIGIQILRNLDLGTRLDLFLNLQFPFLNDLVSSRSGRAILSQSLTLPGDRTYNILVKYMDHGPAGVLGFIQETIIPQSDPNFIASCLLGIKGKRVFKRMVSKVPNEVRMALLDTLTTDSRKAEEFFQKYDADAYSTFVRSFFCTRCESQERCTQETSETEIIKSLVSLLEGLDTQFCLEILNNVDSKIMAKLLPFFSRERKEEILNSLPIARFIKVSYLALLENVQFFDEIKLTEDKETLVNVYKCFLLSEVDGQKIVQASSFLNGLTPLDSAIILANVLHYRKEKNLNLEPIISLGQYLKEEILANFLPFDDYWQTNFGLITEILNRRGEDSTARIFNLGNSYSVAMVLKAEKLSPEFVAITFARMREEKVIEIVDHLLNSPFVGNEQDSKPYLTEVITLLRGENQQLAEKISSIFDINPDSGENGLNYAPIEETGVDEFILW